MSGQEGVFTLGRVEDEIALDSKAEFHAAWMVVEIRALVDGHEVAVAEDRNTVNTVGSQIENAETGIVAIDY